MSIHIAAIGTDGLRPVVWGLGHDHDARVATQLALIEAESELREAGTTSPLRAVQIDQRRVVRISHGDVDASDLWTT